MDKFLKLYEGDIEVIQNRLDTLLPNGSAVEVLNIIVAALENQGLSEWVNYEGSTTHATK